jgi:hypothetical protein
MVFLILQTQSQILLEERFMFLKGDVIPLVQKWGSMPRQAGLEMSLACANADRSGNKARLRMIGLLSNKGLRLIHETCSV